jgi:ribosomal protein L21E
VSDSDRAGGYRFEERNFAEIAYEYSVAGRKLRNNRVSIGEDRGNFQVAETIAKYPVGAVVTVYYNPLHPDQAVLERDLPKGMWGCLGIGTAIALAIVFGSAIGLHQLSEFASNHLANPKVSPFVVAAGGFGLLTALFGLALQRRASLARKWPVVPGTIKSSGLEQFMSAPSESSERSQLTFQSKVSFAYRFKGIEYVSEHASLSGTVSSTSKVLMQRYARKYPTGAKVQVYVNPLDPSDAVLDPRVSHVWIIWASVAFIWGVAYYAAACG